MKSASSVPLRFVILAAPRTGSNMLCTLLNSHPEILCHHEIFNPGGIFYALDLRNTPFRLGSQQERDRDPATFLSRIWQNPLGHNAVGFKLTHRQNEMVLRQVLDGRDVKKIVLHRRNRVRTYVSQLVAETTGVWEAYQVGDLPYRPVRVRVSISALRERIRYDQAYYAEVEKTLVSSGQSYLAVAYEDLFVLGERLRLLDFLQVSSRDLETASQLTAASVRQNPLDLRQIVDNFAELEAGLAGTELEAELKGTCG
jgi:LPS sulfotransferase NodH